LTWALFALSQHEDVQLRLRTEVRSLPLSTSTHDSSPLTQEELAALDKLPLLDAVVRETLRVHAPVPATSREAIQNDEIPLSEPYKDKNGVWRDTISISKGDPVIIPILPMNRSTEIWGEDAHDWKSVSFPRTFLFTH
jgi:cytochrome P450